MTFRLAVGRGSHLIRYIAQHPRLRVAYVIGRGWGCG
jgi:hypothetical protein